MAEQEAEKKLDVLAERIKNVGEFLVELVLEPDPGRDDWKSMQARLDMVRRGMDEVLSILEPALMEASESSELQQLIRERVAGLAMRTGALLQASGDTTGAKRLFREATRITPDTKLRAQYEAAQKEPDLYTRYQHALWLGYHGRAGEADRKLRSLVKETQEPALKEAVRRVLAGPRPVTSAPSLFTLNGCGTGLYGSRDSSEDGSYVATYCLCLLFIPVLPLTAYRVRRVDSSTYQFLAKERLGPIARAWQGIVAASVVLFIAGSAVSSYLNSPERLARLAFEKAQATEASGSREDALQAYRQVIDNHSASETRAKAGDAVVRLSLQGLVDPCTRDAQESAGRITTGYLALPSPARTAESSKLMAERLARCANQVGQATPVDTTTALAIMDLALQVADGTPLHADLAKRQTERRKALAASLQAEQPLEALALYSQMLSDPAALESARALIDSFGPAPSLWLEAESHVQAWINAPKDTAEQRATAVTFKQRLAEAKEAHARNEKLITEGDEAKLTRALKAAPQDQELATTVARLQRDRGDVKAALATLAAVGPMGRMTGMAQMLYALCERDNGQLAEADAHLSRFVAERMQPFQQAQHRYESAAKELQERLVANARAGRLPEDVIQKLNRASEKEQPGIFQAWLIEQMDTDTNLEKLRAEYLRHEVVVPSALALGVLKLQRAAGMEGEARRALLQDAERVFLSIRQEAEDNPRFHLGLGQVYHRLGRTEDGDKELQSLRARKDSRLTEEVASAYRELGLMGQARTLCQEAYDLGADASQRTNAAALCARLAEDLDDEEKWLRRGNVDSPMVQNDLLSLEAQRSLRDGKLVEADRAFAKVASFNERFAKHDAPAANNAAMAYISRYHVTGDAAHLRKAVDHLETAARLAPDNALILANLADALQHLGSVRVLDTWVRTRPLMLSSDQANTLLAALFNGPLRDDVLKVLAKEPALRRAREVGQQVQVLAPQFPTAYSEELLWLHWNRDEAGLAALARRLESLPPFDTSEQAQQRREWSTGERATQREKRTAQRVALAEQVLQRAQESGHKPTQAAASLLLSDALDDLLYFQHGPGKLDALVSASRKAAQLWPQAGLEGQLGEALWKAAVYRAAGKSTELAQGLKEDRGEYGFTLSVHRALERPLADAVRTALRAEPELREAVEHLRLAAKENPSMEQWVIAKDAGDAALERAASAAFARADLASEEEIALRLAGGLAKEKAWHDVFQQGRRTVAQDTP